MEKHGRKKVAVAGLELPDYQAFDQCSTLFPREKHVYL